MREGQTSINEMKDNEEDEMKQVELEMQAEEIMRLAEESGAESNYFFITTFERYQMQLQILEQLKEAIGEEGMLVSKEYVKGRKNIYTNPAVAEYNKTTDSANKTVSTLMKIIKNFGVTDSKGEKDPLVELING